MSATTATVHFLPVATAVERVAGFRPHASTTWRWTKRGVRGVKLETRVVGGRPMTTTEWVEEFIAATTAASA